MFTAKFLRDLGERAIKTFAQTTVAFFTGVATVDAIGGWQQFLIVVVLPTGLSVLSSIASGRVGDVDSAAALPTDRR